MSSFSLFSYGTLQDPKVLSTLIGRVPLMVEGSASGWRAAPLEGVSYPALVTDSSTIAVGVKLLDLTELELNVIDAFENPRYEIQPVQFESPAERSMTLPAYTWPHVATAAPGSWDYEAWLTHQDAYVARVREWRARHRMGPPHESRRIRQIKKIANTGS